MRQVLQEKTAGPALQRTAVLLVSLLVPANAAFGQEVQDPSLKARYHFGPLALNPTIAVTNAGVDTNVFNETDQSSPKQDFTMTVTPATQGWLHLGHTWLNLSLKEGLVYYRQYATERSANTSFSADWQAPLNRVVVDVGGSYLNTRDRPGFEIDARSQRYETGAFGSVEVRAAPKTFVGFRGQWTRVNFDKGAVFLDSNLHYELNRTVTVNALTVRYRLTPITSATFELAREQDRFEFSSLRDANSTSVTAGLKFDPRGLIRGNASFGYRDFQPLPAGIPGYRGTMGALDLSYVGFGSTQLTAKANRDVNYSYDINQPYYVLTGITISADQHVYRQIDLVGRIGVQRLDYRDRVGAAVAVASETDSVHTVGGGVGYRLSSDVRIDFNLDQSHRKSAVPGRGYHGLQFGSSVTYGF